MWTPLRYGPALLGVVFLALYSALSLLRFRRFKLSSWDNAIFEQAIKSYAGLGPPTVDIKGAGFNLLGDHFSPVIALVAPFYRLFPAAQTILLAQAVLLAASVVVIARVTMRRLGPVAGTAISIAYGLSFGIQSAVKADFHEVAFAAPLLALAGAAYVDRRWAHVVWWSLPLLLVKEDLGLTVALIGFVLIVCGQRRRGAWLAAAGVAGMLLVLLVFVPYFNPAGGYDYVTGVGGDGGVIGTLFSGFGQKVVTVLVTFAVTGFLALRSPWALLVLPTFGWRFVGGTEYYWGIDWHYSLVLMPIVFIAMIDAVVRSPDSRRLWLRQYASFGAAVAMGFALAMQLTSPLSALAHAQTYESSSRAGAANKVLSLIPPGASVETDIGLIAHLVTDHTVYWIGTAGDVAADYMLFDAEAGWSEIPDVVAYADEKTGLRYELIFDDDGYSLARRMN